MTAALTNLHRQRWEAARGFIRRMLAKAEFVGAQLMFRDAVIQRTDVLISETAITVRLSPHCTCMIFEADPEFDHGLYQTVAEWRAETREDFKLVKVIAW